MTTVSRVTAIHTVLLRYSHGYSTYTVDVGLTWSTLGLLRVFVLCVPVVCSVRVSGLSWRVEIWGITTGGVVLHCTLLRWAVVTVTVSVTF